MAGDGDDLSGRDLSGADLSGTNLVNTDLSEADLSDADLSGANLTNADLKGADLTGADLDGANLTNANLADADLTDTTLSGATMVNTSFEGGEADLQSRVGSAVVGLTLLVGLGLLFAGVSNFWVVFVLGFAVVLPLTGAIAGWYEERTAGAESDEEGSDDERTDALAELRRRYADGEIEEAEFERRVERLLETESVADAEDAYGDPGRDSPVDPPSVERELERERE